MTRYFVLVARNPEEYANKVQEIQNVGYQISMINFNPPDAWTITYFMPPSRVEDAPDKSVQ